ncbi:hypothetical protein JG688_00010740 [Phytophthora aleatoria]|uniref:C2 domain-containing protein n=1 Tax=Phytophthora aleatoria TaxID=2496075 RepID=A0A8J5J4P4_9STRA|nr:hypothetical protein JG688_00010740 [Phytophthora aleatoria]
MVDVVDEATEQLVVRLQTLYRARRARREAVELANSAYLKCWDAVSGLAYYCNLRTGLSSWKKPLLLAARDSVEPSVDTNIDVKAPVEAPVKSNSDPILQLSLKARQQRREESLVFKKKCEDEKRELVLRHRRKIARAMRRFEKNLLDEKSKNRQERQAKLKNDNQQLLQDLYEGKKKENVQTIREAAMRGNLDRVETLLDMGFSADAESAMGLTPLLAACQSGRTALMEAASRAKPPVLKELLRYGARIHVEDEQGETVFDCMKDAANREIIERACQVWSSENAALFPTEFRQERCDQLEAAIGNEHFDMANGVSRDVNGKSLATLDVSVEQGENLPYRDPRIGDLIDPYVRVFLRSASALESTELFKSEMRLADRNPVWELCCQIPAVPSVQKELGIQVVDAKREDIAGESIVLTRELQQLMKTREVLVKKRRDIIQNALDIRLQQLP